MHMQMYACLPQAAVIHAYLRFYCMMQSVSVLKAAKHTAGRATVSGG